MSKQASMGSWIGAVVVVLAVVVAGVFLARRALHPNEPTHSVPATAASAAPSTGPVTVQHPISEAATAPASAATAALPALGDSDASVATALTELAGSGQFSSLLVHQQIIPRIVATIDALPRRGGWGARMLPARPPAGAFSTEQVDGNTVSGSGNAARYAPYMQVVEDADPQAVVAWYVRSYPLFQQAYRELGYPKGYFNDRLIAVIDNLLAAPELAQPPALQPSKGVYVYADPALESLSAGQRLLLRGGSVNEAKIKAKLRAIRAQLVGQKLPATPASSGTTG